MVVNSYKVLEDYIYNDSKRYKVQCLLCGKTHVVSETALQKPCPCVIVDDVVGETFTNLFVGGKFSKNQRVYCRCVCQLCGNTTIVSKTNLVSGHTKSCGCLKEPNLEGKTFGKLTVGKRTVKAGRAYYYCLCRLCGKTVLKRADTIPLVTSCGCDSIQTRADALREKSFVDGTQPAKIQLNKSPSKANKSGVVGVCWDKSRGKWMAGIKFKGKRYNLGRYDNIQDAIDARHEAEKQIFGDFLAWYDIIK